MIFANTKMEISDVKNRIKMQILVKADQEEFLTYVDILFDLYNEKGELIDSVIAIEKMGTPEFLKLVIILKGNMFYLINFLVDGVDNGELSVISDEDILNTIEEYYPEEMDINTYQRFLLTIKDYNGKDITNILLDPNYVGI